MLTFLPVGPVPVQQGSECAPEPVWTSSQQAVAISTETFQRLREHVEWYQLKEKKEQAIKEFDLRTQQLQNLKPYKVFLNPHLLPAENTSECAVQCRGSSWRYNISLHFVCKSYRTHAIYSTVFRTLTNRAVLLSTLLQDILHPSRHLLNVLLQIANKFGLSNKKYI
jgi:hypothetical protein